MQTTYTMTFFIDATATINGITLTQDQCDELMDAACLMVPFNFMPCYENLDAKQKMKYEARIACKWMLQEYKEVCECDVTEVFRTQLSVAISFDNSVELDRRNELINELAQRIMRFKKDRGHIKRTSELTSDNSEVLLDKIVYAVVYGKDPEWAWADVYPLRDTPISKFSFWDHEEYRFDNINEDTIYQLVSDVGDEGLSREEAVPMLRDAKVLLNECMSLREKYPDLKVNVDREVLYLPYTSSYHVYYASFERGPMHTE